MRLEIVQTSLGRINSLTAAVCAETVASNRFCGARGAAEPSRMASVSLTRRFNIKIILPDITTTIGNDDRQFRRMAVSAANPIIQLFAL
jgi:hypothetical protein